MKVIFLAVYALENGVTCFIILPFMDRKARIPKKATILLDRLERLSADSSWAHRASGLRGALMKILSQDGFISNQKSTHQLESIIQAGYTILNNAARDIRGRERLMTEELRKKNDG